MTWRERVDRIGDKIVSLWSPKAAWNRAHYRLMKNDAFYRDSVIAVKRAAGYKSAKSPTGQTPWIGGDDSADSHITHDLPTLRSRSQELNRDDPIASGLTSTFVHNIVGMGIGLRPQARTGNTEKNQRLEAVWKERQDSLALADNMIQGEMQRMHVFKHLEDGAIYIKRVKRKPSEPVWFESIEAARVWTPINVKSVDEGGNIADGVEKDSAGVPVAYWVNTDPSKQTEDGFDRVPASQLRHWRKADRAGQTHGIPMFHAILQDLRDLDLLLEASLKRVQIAACLAVFIESSSEISQPLGVENDTSSRIGGRLENAIEPGMMWQGGPGETFSTLVPNFPTPELVPFIVTLARRIGSALGVTWQIVLKDFSESTYSGARTDLLEARPVYLATRHSYRVVVLDWMWREVMADALLMGDARLAGVTPDELSLVHWIPPGWQWVDPLKEGQAVALKLALKVTTLRDECAALGTDWEEVQDQTLIEEKRERDKRKAMKLPMPEDEGQLEGEANDVTKQVARLLGPALASTGISSDIFSWGNNGDDKDEND